MCEAEDGREGSFTGAGRTMNAAKGPPSLHLNPPAPHVRGKSPRRGTPTGEELAEQSPELTQGRKRPVLPPAGKAGKQTRVAHQERVRRVSTGEKVSFSLNAVLVPPRKA